MYTLLFILQLLILKIHLLMDIVLVTDKHFMFSFACNKISHKLTPLSNKIHLVLLRISRYFVNLSILLIFDSLSLEIETKYELINDWFSSVLRPLLFILNLQHCLIYEFASPYSLNHIVPFHSLSSNIHNQQLDLQ